MSTNERLLKATAVAGIEPDRLDAMLDEALGETFPASDPIAITPVRREVGEDDPVIPNAATVTPPVGDAVRDSERRPIRQGDRP